MPEEGGPKIPKSIKKPERDFTEFSARDKKLQNDLLELIRAANGASMRDFWEERSNFAKSLRVKYPNAERHQIFNALLGGTMGKNDNITEDFPGEDSVVKFIEAMKAKYGRKA